MFNNGDINELVEIYARLPNCLRRFVLWGLKIYNRRASIDKVTLSALLGVFVGLIIYTVLQPSPQAVWAALLGGYYTSTTFIVFR